MEGSTKKPSTIVKLFRAAGFNVQKDQVITGERVDNVVKFGDRLICIQASDEDITNSIMIWQNKNKVVEADRIVLFIGDRKPKAAETRSAKQANILLWNEEKNRKLISYLDDPKKLKSDILQELKLEHRNIDEINERGLRKLVWMPILSGKKQSESEMYNLFLNALKERIRTYIDEIGLSPEEMKEHLELFENLKIKDNISNAKQIKVKSSKKLWDNIKLNLGKISNKENVKTYLGYMQDLEDGYQKAEEYFSESSKDVRERLIHERIIDFIDNQDVHYIVFGYLGKRDHSVRFGFDDNRGLFLSFDGRKQEAIKKLRWIIGSDEDEVKQTKEFDKEARWYFENLQIAVDVAGRMFDEFYEINSENLKFVDFSLKRKKLSCFIATAAYGTPYARELYVLRDFRDDVLIHNFIGKAFVEFYYLFSPFVARIIRGNRVLKSFVRIILSPVIWLLSNRK